MRLPAQLRRWRPYPRRAGFHPFLPFTPAPTNGCCRPFADIRHAPGIVCGEPVDDIDKGRVSLVNGHSEKSLHRP
jgi:hypothetical protein